MDNERFSMSTLEFASLRIRVAAWTGGAVPAGLIKGDAYSMTLRSRISFTPGPRRHHLLSGSGSRRVENAEFPTCPSATPEPAAHHSSTTARMSACCKDHACVENLPPKGLETDLCRAGCEKAGVAGRGLSLVGFLFAASRL